MLKHLPNQSAEEPKEAPAAAAAEIAASLMHSDRLRLPEKSGSNSLSHA